MRHKKLRHQLNRFSSWHKSTINSLARNLLIHQSINTTLSRAKAVRPLVEKLITLAKKNTLAARREAVKTLLDHKLVSILFNDIGPRFSKRVGGYTRIINVGPRRGDDAKLVVLELTEMKEKKIKKPKKEKETEPKEVIDEQNIEEGKLKASEASAKEIEKEKEKEKPPITKKAPKKFLGGIRGIFKKQRDSL